MDLSDAIRDRRSTRRFKPDPVPAELLDACLDDARWAPSWSNTQPYRVAIARGAARDRIVAALTASFDEGMALARAPSWKKLWAVARGARGRVPRGELRVPLDYPEDLQAARRATGFGLYKVLGIARDDRTARDAQMRRNYELFGAPVALFVFVHEGLGVYAALDAGLFLQSFLLACHARGLATCAQGALALWADPVRAEFDVPPHYRLLVGCSIGYAEDHAVNAYNPGRAPLETLRLRSRGG